MTAKQAPTREQSRTEFGWPAAGSSRPRGARLAFRAAAERRAASRAPETALKMTFKSLGFWGCGEFELKLAAREASKADPARTEGEQELVIK